MSSVGLFALSQVSVSVATSEGSPSQDVSSLAFELANFIDPVAAEDSRLRSHVVSHLLSSEESVFLRDCIETCLRDPLHLGEIRFQNQTTSAPQRFSSSCHGTPSAEMPTLLPPLQNNPSAKISPNAPLTARTAAKTTSLDPVATLNVPSLVIRHSGTLKDAETETHPLTTLRIFGAEDFNPAQPVPLKTIRLRDSTRLSTPVEDKPSLSAPAAEFDWDLKTIDAVSNRDAISNSAPLSLDHLSLSQRVTLPSTLSRGASLRNPINTAVSFLHLEEQSNYLTNFAEFQNHRRTCPKGAYKLFRMYMRIAKAAASSSFDESELHALSEWRLPLDDQELETVDACQTRLRNMAEILSGQIPRGHNDASPVVEKNSGPQLIPLDSMIHRLNVWLLQSRVYDMIVRLQSRPGSPERGRVPRLLMISQPDTSPLNSSASSSFLSDFLLRLASLDLLDMFLYVLSQLPVSSKAKLALEQSAFGETFLHKLVAVSVNADQVNTYVRFFLQYCPLTKSQLDASNHADGNRTALHMATKRGLQEVMQFLLLSGSSPNVKDNTGSTPTHTAIWFNQPACLLTLLYHPDLDLNAEDDMGRNLMALAVDAGDPQCLSMLINRGAPVALFSSRAQSTRNNNTPECQAHVNDLDLRVCNIADRRLSNFLKKLLVGNGLLPTCISTNQLNSIERILRENKWNSPAGKAREGETNKTLLPSLSDSRSTLPVWLLLGQPLGHAVAQKQITAGRVGGANARTPRDGIFIYRDAVSISPTDKIHVEEFMTPPAGVTSRCVFGDSLQSVCLACSAFFWKISSDIREAPRPSSVTPRRSLRRPSFTHRGSHTPPNNSYAPEPRFASTNCRNCSIPLCDQCTVFIKRLVVAPFPFLEDLPRLHTGQLIVQSTVREASYTRGSLRRFPPGEGGLCVPPGRAFDEPSKASPFLTCGASRKNSVSVGTRGPGMAARLLCIPRNLDSVDFFTTPDFSDQAIERAISSAPQDVLAVLALGQVSPSKVGVEWSDTTTTERTPFETLSPREGTAPAPAVLGHLGQWSATVLGVRSTYRRLAQVLSSSLSPLVMRSIGLARNSTQAVMEHSTTPSGDSVSPPAAGTSGAFLLGLCTPRTGNVRESASETTSFELTSFVSPSMSPSASLLQGAFASSELLLQEPLPGTVSASLERRLNVPSLATEIVTVCQVCASFYSTLPLRFQLRVLPAAMNRPAGRNRSETVNSSPWRTHGARDEIKTAHH
eukprot:Gregarina_sp_Poly_1__5744@NODE_301_length_9763_cov_48_882632_g260_i0_p1_GENE_NODE_301_length_9763_cov_48_882632_g260_i0NODE_301_length_9763_cov_48_882632_g260_i0_p1_ORF_typecomplete_len1233_score186_86Ank_2/PF12796_7/1_3e04Ank_2/PF12796_7/1_7e10Ank_2/PF12796_7/0_054Ank_5/PF13857_6/9_5e03Ank_5/PF13857_6/9_4e10Ank_5/PF13857_6/0_049Ank_4/PF13637_6/1e04Ank_4/PF13637_6/6_4e09Ank_4/PF13637_6/0_41Ank/PF00023_30/0_00023Ank/PF00023_30/1_3e03Ank/PF00023_30/7_2Ank_3/PF13606_6/1_8Ank_3/PF13606_6/1_5e02_NODE